MLFKIFARHWLDSGIDNTHPGKFDGHGVASLHYFSEIVHSVADFCCRCFLHVPNIAAIVAALDLWRRWRAAGNALTPDARGVAFFGFRYEWREVRF